jgi:ketosteroid isomerase-like protein
MIQAGLVRLDLGLRTGSFSCKQPGIFWCFRISLWRCADATQRGKNVSQEQTARIAQQLLTYIGAGAEPNEIAALFSADVQFEVPGDVGALPWIGRRTGSAAVSDFIRGTRHLIERVRFDVQGILADEGRAVIFGDLASKVNATGKIIESPFALILNVSDGKITRFQMLEDSFAVSRAARSLGV